MPPQSISEQVRTVAMVWLTLTDKKESLTIPLHITTAASRPVPIPQSLVESLGLHYYSYTPVELTVDLTVKWQESQWNFNETWELISFTFNTDTVAILECRELVMTSEPSINSACFPPSIQNRIVFKAKGERERERESGWEVMTLESTNMIWNVSS